MTARGDRAVDSFDVALRLVAIAAALGLGAIGFAMPESLVGGALAWLVFLVAVCSGWGFIVARIARVEDPDLGLRALWGMCGYLAIGGVLLAAGVLTRPVTIALLGLGAAGFAWRELTTQVASVRSLGRVAALWREHPGWFLLALILVGLAVLNITGAISSLDRNPWDDDLAYTPFVRRLLERGDLIEPFSFRRLGAYGGQTLLHALGGARGTLANVHLADKGLCYAIALLLFAGYAKTQKTQPLWLAVVALVVLLMPDTSINTASYWSGVAVFIGLYRTVVDGRWAVAGLVGAAACTLRQNYVAIAVLFLGIALLSQLVTTGRATSWGAAWRAQRRSWGLALGVATLVLVPYWIAAYRASGTFLFPFIDGTWNPSISLHASGATWTDELQFLLWCFIETHPIVLLPPIFAVIVVSSDPRPTRPVMAMLVASIVGFLLMVHSFVGSDANHLWRYAAAAAIALLGVFALEVGADDEAGKRLVPFGRWILLATLLLQLAVQREALPKRFATLLGNIKEARHGDTTARVEQRRYTELQAAIPDGASVAVMLDDPAYLDYRRNQIFNLDTPGYASPRPGMPAFAGPEAVRAYFLERGIRYVAFVRSERSRYFFRRSFWVWRLFNDAEIFQLMSAYVINAIDTFAALEKSAVAVREVDGMVLLDLGTAAPSVPPITGTEAERRAAFVRAVADKEQLHDAWALNSREDVLFEDGFTGLVFLDGATDDPTWWDVLHPPPVAATKGTPARWMYRRAHVRVRGSGERNLVLRGTVNLGAIYTRPRLDVSLDGGLIASVVVDEQGSFDLETVIGADRLTGDWQDLYLVWSSVAEPQKDVRDLRSARLERFEWEAP